MSSGRAIEIDHTFSIARRADVSFVVILSVIHLCRPLGDWYHGIRKRKAPGAFLFRFRTGGGTQSHPFRTLPRLDGGAGTLKDNERERLFVRSAFGCLFLRATSDE